ncbi:MAG: flagellar hook-basal body complex protein, partial [Oscillospiraceae bacterium]
MTRGFYSLGSSMLTQNRMLSAISNNIANVKTVGFKKDMVISTTFKDMVMNRIENQKANPLDDVTMLRTADETFTIHSQGNLESTERALDFAILEEGFFKIRNVNT